MLLVKRLPIIQLSNRKENFTAQVEGKVDKLLARLTELLFKVFKMIEKGEEKSPRIFTKINGNTFTVVNLGIVQNTALTTSIENHSENDV